MMGSFCVFFFVHFQQTQNNCAITTKCFTQYCEILLKMFTNIKTFGLNIIAKIFLIIFELPFSQHFEIYHYNIAKNIR